MRLTLIGTHIGNGDAAHFWVTKAQKKGAVGLVLEEDMEMMFSNEAINQSAGAMRNRFL